MCASPSPLSSRNAAALAVCSDPVGSSRVVRASASRVAVSPAPPASAPRYAASASRRARSAVAALLLPGALGQAREAYVHELGRRLRVQRLDLDLGEAAPVEEALGAGAGGGHHANRTIVDTSGDESEHHCARPPAVGSARRARSAVGPSSTLGNGQRPLAAEHSRQPRRKYSRWSTRRDQRLPTPHPCWSGSLWRPDAPSARSAYVDSPCLATAVHRRLRCGHG